MNTLYAKALQRVSEKGVDDTTLISNLMKHLREKGREKLLPGILRELKILKEQEKYKKGVLEVARESEKKSAQEAVEKAGITTDDIRINPSLIRGWRARSGSTLVDRSAKRSLIDLYERIID